MIDARARRIEYLHRRKTKSSNSRVMNIEQDGLMNMHFCSALSFGTSQCQAVPEGNIASNQRTGEQLGQFEHEN